MSRDSGIAVALLLLAGSTELVVFSDGQGPIRFVLVLAFLLLAPGWAIQRLAGTRMPISARVAMALGISTALDMGIATALLYLRLWSMELALTVVVLIVVVAVLVGLPAARRSITDGVRRAGTALADLGRE